MCKFCRTFFVPFCFLVYLRISKLIGVNTYFFAVLCCRTFVYIKKYIYLCTRIAKHSETSQPKSTHDKTTI